MPGANVAIHLRDRDEEIMDKIEALSGAAVLSIITRVELEGGVYADPARAHLRRPRLKAMFETLPVLDFDQAAADAYRDIRATVGYSRRKVLDRMIGAQALVHRAALVTRNPDDFRDIPGLEILAW